MLQLKRTKSIFLFILLMSLVGFSPIIGFMINIQGNKANENANFNLTNNYQENNSKNNNFEINEAPSVDSFFEKYDSSSYITPESYLPRNLSDANLGVQSYDDYLDNFVANIDLSKVAYSFGELVEFSVQVFSNLAPASDLQIKILILEGDSYYYWNYDHEDVTILFEYTTTTDENGFYEGTFTPPNEGSYTIMVIPTIYSDYAIARRVVTVSDIAVFWRIPFEALQQAKTRSYALVVNTSDFTPLLNANISLYTEEWFYIDSSYSLELSKIYSGITDENGLLIIDFQIPVGVYDYFYLLLQAEKDGSIVSIRQHQYFMDYLWYYDDYYKEYSFITTTDKPIYQPGDSLKVRSIVFFEDYWKASKEPVSNEAIEVEFQSPQGFTLFHDILVTDDYGVINWDFLLDQDAELGVYSIIYTKEGSIDTYYIEITTYIKPDFQVNIDLEREFVPPEDYIEGTVTAEYFFGKPVPGNIKIEFYYYYTLLGEIEGTLNSEGRYAFSWKVPKYKPYLDEPIEAVVVKALVVDIVDREVSAEKEVTCLSNLYAYLWSHPWGVVKKGEIVTLYFNAFQVSIRGQYDSYSWSAVANAEVELSVYGIKASNRKKHLFDISSTTNEYGRGSEEIKLADDYLDKYSLFEVELKVITEDGRTGEDSIVLSVAIIEAQIEISPNKVFSAGETVEVTINYKNIKTNKLVAGLASIYVMDAEYDTICYAWDITTDGSESFSIDLSNFAPEGKYRINTYFRFNQYYTFTFPRYASGHSEFVVGNDYSLTIEATKNEYSASEGLLLLGYKSYSSSTPTIIEISKRGIVDIFSIDGSLTSFSLYIDNLQGLGPKLTVFCFSITNTGLIMEAYDIITIIEEINITIESDKETYEPGESAKLNVYVTDENGEPLDVITVFSLIDSSIFSVREDELSEERYYEEQYYWSRIATRTSWTAPMTFWWYWWTLEENSLMYDTNYYALPHGEEYFDSYTLGGGSADLEFKGDIRDNLPESANWIPTLEINDGFLELTVDLPDNIGEWTVRIFASTATKGKVAKHTFKTFLPFFVDLKIPQGIIQDNVVIIKGIAYNYLESTSTVTLTLEADNLTLLNKPTQTIVLPNDYLAEIRWSIYCDDFGLLNTTLTGIAKLGDNYYYDGIRRELKVEPNGVKLEQITSGFLNESVTIDYELFRESIFTSMDLVLSPGAMDVAIESWERLIGYPYGCIEQTMSKLFPDIMIYQYLESTNQLTSSLENTLKLMLESGLSRIASYQNSDGGWGWWKDDQSQIFMTAIVLYGLGLMKQLGLELNSDRILDGINFLFLKQNTSGGFTSNSWRIDDLSFTAYVIRTLVLLEISDINHILKLNNAIDYFTTEWNLGSDYKNPYAAALFIDATIDTDYENSTFIDDLENYIINQKIVEDNGFKWQVSDTNYWSALGGEVETTATVIIALLKSNYLENFIIIQKATKWLLEQQSTYGWGNTADTSSAIRAIIEVDSLTSETINCNVAISLNDYSINYEFNETTTPKLYSELLSLENYLQEDNNTLTINQTGSGSIYYYLKSVQILREDPQITTNSPIYVTSGEIFDVIINLTTSSSNVLPTNILISNLETDFELLNSANQSLQLLNVSEQITFSYRAPTTPGEYQVGGYFISYTFIDSKLTNFAKGYISKTIAPVSVIVETSTALKTATAKAANINQKYLKIDSEYNIDLTRDFSKLQNISKGDTIEIDLIITNNWEVKEFIMIEEHIPAGFVFDESSVSNNQEIIDYSLNDNKVTFFLDELSLGETRITIRIIAYDVGSSIIVPTKISSMYEQWFVENDPIIIGSKGVFVDPVTGSVKIDAISPILLSEELFLEEINEEFYEVALKFSAFDENEISSVVVIYTDESGNWITEEAILVEIFENNTREFALQLGRYVNNNLSYIIAIEDNYGNVYYSELNNYFIPKITVAITLILILIIVSLIIASSTSIISIVSRPKIDTTKIIDSDRRSAFKDSKEDLEAYKALEEYKNSKQ